MEQYDLSTPEKYPSDPPATSHWKVDEIHLKWTAQLIEIVLKGANGERRREFYSGPTAVTLMTQLNTINLSTTSLQKRILQRLAADGKLAAGAITGAPD